MHWKRCFLLEGISRGRFWIDEKPVALISRNKILSIRTKRDSRFRPRAGRRARIVRRIFFFIFDFASELRIRNDFYGLENMTISISDARFTVSHAVLHSFIP